MLAGRVKVRTDWPAVMVTTSGPAGTVGTGAGAGTVVGGWAVVDVVVTGTVVGTSAAVALVVGAAACCSFAAPAPLQPASNSPANTVQDKPYTVRHNTKRNELGTGPP